MDAINIKAEAAKIQNLFEYMTIAKMNGHVFTLVKVKDRTLEFHTHQDSDEVFYIVDGEMKLEFRDKIINLTSRPSPELHRTSRSVVQQPSSFVAASNTCSVRCFLYSSRRRRQ